MWGNSIFTTPLGQCVPERLLMRWQNESRPSESFLCQNVAPCNLVDNLPLSGCEYAGRIGFQWFTRKQGGSLAIFADLQGMFSWHFHPDGALRFSPEDWLIFLVSACRLTALIISGAAMVLQKEPPCEPVCTDVQRIFLQHAVTPLLTWQRALRMVRQRWNCDLESGNDAAIATALGIRLFMEPTCL